MDEKEIKVTEEMQKVVQQMRLDDLEEDPTLDEQYFDCDCCAKTKPLTGSIQYENYRLCNDCVLIAEIAFELKKINCIQDLIDANEDKRLEEICNFIKHEQNKTNN